MTEIDHAYVFVRDNYNSTDLMPGAITTCEVGEETVRNARTFHLADGSTVTLTPAGFRAWLDLDGFACFMGARPPHWRGGYWPNFLERGFRALKLEFTAPDDALDAIVNLSLFPDARAVVTLSRADVIEELTADAIYDLVPPRTQRVNYSGARNSLQELMG